jgi:peroxiredoxin
MKRYAALFAIGFVFVQTQVGACQQGDSEAAADARRFQTLLTVLATHLQTSPAYAVEIASHWKIASEDKKRDKEGRNRFKLVRESGDRLRIEANPGDQLQPTLVSVCDGKVLTTYLRPSGIFERKPTGDAPRDLLHSQFVATSLQGTGIDLLLMKDWPIFLEKTISQLDFTGKEKLDGEELDHFKMNWGKDTVEMWFKTGKPPLLSQYRRTVTVPVQEKTSVRVVTTARLKWNFAPAFPPATFQIDMPATARQVPSVYDALVKGEKAVVLGKPAPRLGLELLDGTPLDLASFAGRKEVAVLFYFASWSMPGAERLEALTRLVQNFRRQGVVFYGVNVGESKDDVTRLVAAHKLDMPVALDPSGKSTDDFLINSIPAVVLIGKSGTVQAVLQGPEIDKNIIDRITQDLDRLVKGELLVPGQ